MFAEVNIECEALGIVSSFEVTVGSFVVGALWEKEVSLNGLTWNAAEDEAEEAVPEGTDDTTEVAAHDAAHDAASDATGEPVEVAVLDAAEDAARDATSE